MPSLRSPLPPPDPPRLRPSASSTPGSPPGQPPSPAVSAAPASPPTGPNRKPSPEPSTPPRYEFVTFDFSAASLAETPFVQISISDYADTGDNFLAAYSGSYNPANQSLHYLGDAGSSPDYFGTDAVSFQVTVPKNQDLILVLNDTHTGNYKGAGSETDILVEGFTDNNFDDPVTPSAVPEPSTFALLGTGLTGLVGLGRRVRRS